MTTPNPYGSPAPGAYPPPGYGAPAPVRAPGAPASLGRRVGAYVIDTVIVSLVIVVWVVLGVVISGALQDATILFVFAAVAWLLAVGWIFIYSALQGGHGSIGMRLMKIQLVRLETGTPLGFGRALLRNVVWGAAGAIIVGFFSVLFDRSGLQQGWHDKAVHGYMRDAQGVPAAPAATPHTTSVPPVSPVAPAYGGAAFPTYAASSPEPVAPPAATVIPAPAAPVPPAVSYDGQVPPRPPLPGPPLPEPPIVPVAAAPLAPLAPTPAEAAGLIAFVPGITQDPPAFLPQTSAVPAAPAVPPAPADPAAEDDIDGDTVLVRPPAVAPEPEPEGDLEDTRLVVRTRPALLEWDDSTQHTVASRALFGRNPQAVDGADAVAVRDETLSLSKTHFEIVVDAETVSVIDQHSTNGVIVVRSGERITAEPGTALVLQDGDALEIGDRIVTFKGRG